MSTMRLAALFTTAILISTPTLADEATGFVFHDANNNGVRDTGEVGVPNVRVSNGVQVVATDADGAYRLPVTDETIIFVIKPRDWMTAINELNLPRFYYIHKPAGSAKLRFPGVKPTGPLPESIDFPLTPRQEPNRFEVLLFGDSQPTSIEAVDYFAHDVIEPLVGADAAFGFSLGDVVGDRLNLHGPVNDAVAHIGIPFYNIPGNHDRNYDAADDNHAFEAFSRVYGPPYYAFDFGPVHFIVLDSVVHIPGKDGKKPRYHGGLGKTQLEFLRNNLKHVPKNQLVVLTMHIPLVEFKDRAELFALLADRPHTVSFSAHMHYHKHWFLGPEEDWHGKTPHHHTTFVTTCGSWWTGAPDEVGLPHTTMRDGSPNGWCIATFVGNQYSYRFVPARRPADYQMNIFTPDVVKVADVAKTEVVVNVFVGSERSTVTMRVAGGPWATLERVKRVDPYYAAMKEAEKSKRPPRGRKLPKPIESSHIWQGMLPDGLNAGSHLIEVRTTDMFGQTYTGRRIIRVE